VGRSRTVAIKYGSQEEERQMRILKVRKRLMRRAQEEEASESLRSWSRRGGRRESKRDSKEVVEKGMLEIET